MNKGNIAKSNSKVAATVLNGALISLISFLVMFGIGFLAASSGLALSALAPTKTVVSAGTVLVMLLTLPMLKAAHEDKVARTLAYGCLSSMLLGIMAFTVA